MSFWLRCWSLIWKHSLLGHLLLSLLIEKFSFHHKSGSCDNPKRPSKGCSTINSIAQCIIHKNAKSERDNQGTQLSVPELLGIFDNPSSGFHALICDAQEHSKSHRTTRGNRQNISSCLFLYHGNVAKLDPKREGSCSFILMRTLNAF